MTPNTRKKIGVSGAQPELGRKRGVPKQELGNEPKLSFVPPFLAPGPPS
jgi:hypothetical protein